MRFDCQNAPPKINAAKLQLQQLIFSSAGIQGQLYQMSKV